MPNIKTDMDLMQMFQNNIRTGAHLAYNPIIKNFFRNNNMNKTIYGFYFQNHYTALIPKCKNIPQFITTNTIL